MEISATHYQSWYVFLDDPSAFVGPVMRPEMQKLSHYARLYIERERPRTPNAHLTFHLWHQISQYSPSMVSFRVSVFVQLMNLLASTCATTIQWGTCADNFESAVPVDCGTLLVPLDYTVSSNETYTLELLRAPAPVQPAKGSIVLNFGGPGEVGRATLVGNASLLQVYVCPIIGSCNNFQLNK